MATAEFWYEFASTYSYPAALRVAALAEERGVSLVWRPFLLGPVFAAQGWRDSPFNLYPAKGRYMWRDLERTCRAMGVPLKRPEPFPQPSLLAARVALALRGDARVNFSRLVFASEFSQGLPIGDRATLGPLLAACSVDPATAFEVFTNQLPWERSPSSEETLRRHLNTPPRDPVDLKPDLGEDLSRVLLKSIAREPTDRYPSADAFKQALLRLERQDY